MNIRYAVLLIVAIALMSGFANAQQTGVQTERNVVYGMYSGLALLLDVHKPDQPNGKGVIFIQGCGWHAPLAKNARELKSGGAVDALAKPLAAHGFTVFTINHRASPTFRYPAHIQDAQRAVRWVRENANRYSIDAKSLAAVGGSSGGHLSLMLGLLPGDGELGSSDPVERHGSRVSCVVALAPATDLVSNDWPSETATVVASFIGKPRWPSPSPEYFEASPISYAKQHAGTNFLLIHGDDDKVVPYSQSAALTKRLRAAGAAVKLVSQPGIGHGVPQLVGSETDSDVLLKWTPFIGPRASDS